MDQASSYGSVDVDALYRRYVVMVRQRALRLTGDEALAQQVAEETVLKLLDSRAPRDASWAQAAFLYRTATNLALNKLRAGQRQRDAARWRSPSGASGHEMLQMREILALVSYDEAQVAAYRYVDGLEADEVAELLGIERQAVEARLRAFEARALRLVKVTGGGRRVA